MNPDPAPMCAMGEMVSPFSCETVGAVSLLLFVGFGVLCWWLGRSR